MVFLSKFYCSSWKIRHLVLLRFLVACDSGNSFLDNDLQYGRLSGATILGLLESSL